MNPFISICIPAYKNAGYLELLLDSIAIQHYKDFEVLVSDDSPDNSVEKLCAEYSPKFSLQYKKNNPDKGSPANWNESIRMAKGNWIKIMHDDDWFATADSLEQFANAAKENAGAGFIFSGYTKYKDGKAIHSVVPGASVKNKLRDPLNLIAENYIGHPSTTLVKNERIDWFDERTKWVVDIEFYIRCLKSTTYHFIPAALINIGISNEQITQTAFRNKNIEIPEYLYLLEKMGEGILKNISVYDHYWRLFRNLDIRSFEQIEEVVGKKELPGKLIKMLKMEFRLPISVLKIGVLSKMFMSISFMRNRN